MTELRPENSPLLTTPAEPIPYLIVAPKYNPKSAGVRVLHELCHSLNQMGQKAWLTIYPQLVMDKDQSAHVCPGLHTPLMTQAILDSYESRGISPIVVYPETMKDPLQATHTVRYVLNYPGLLGGYTTYPANDMIYAYSRCLAKAAGVGEERVLFLPVSETNIFYPPAENSPRSGTCFYASKYKNFHKGKLFPVTDGSFEITANQCNSLTKPELGDLFRRSELLYIYEDSAIAIEAALCGCPVVFLPNEFLTNPLGFDDLGMDGFAWGDAPEEVVRAKASVHKFGANYAALLARYQTQLAGFVAQTQQEVRASQRAITPIDLPKPTFCQTVRFVGCYLRQHGIKRFLLKAQTLIKKLGMRCFVENTLKNSFGR